MLNDMLKTEFIEKACALGADVFFLAPSAFPQYEGNSRGIGTDPFAQLPSVTCIVALVWGYAPVVKRENPQLSAYYIASHRGHMIADQLRVWLSEQGAETAMADLPVRAVLERANIAAVGRNGLAAMREKGSFLYAKLILTDAFAPEQTTDSRLPCIKCGRCEKACPVGAIGESFDPYRCIRHHLDGTTIDEVTKKSMVSLLGCEICQRACPRNAEIASAAADEEIERLFSFESLIESYPRKALSAVVGKNMTGGGRLRAQALVLAAKAKNGSFAEISKELQSSEQPCLADAAQWYVERFLTKKR